MKNIEKQLEENDWKVISEGAYVRLYAKEDLRIMYDAREEKIILNYRIRE